MGNFARMSCFFLFLKQKREHSRFVLVAWKVTGTLMHDWTRSRTTKISGVRVSLCIVHSDNNAADEEERRSCKFYCNDGHESNMTSQSLTSSIKF